MNREQLIVLISILVSGCWVAVALVSLFLKDYTALSIITPVMLIVTGFLYGKSNGNKNGS